MYNMGARDPKLEVTAGHRLLLGPDALILDQKEVESVISSARGPLPNPFPPLEGSCVRSNGQV